MQDYTININQVEELQTIKDIAALENIFTKARSAIVNGAKVVLARQNASGRSGKFDELSTLQDLDQYKKTVFKYL